MSYKPGDRVLIVEDCRGIEPSATGMQGVYEGDMPIGVWITNDGQDFSQEYDYDAFMANAAYKEAYPVWCPGEPKPSGPCAMLDTNPMIRLNDGGVIWGYECWWRPIKDEPPHDMDEEVANLEHTKAFIRTLAHTFCTDPDVSTPEGADNRTV